MNIRFSGLYVVDLTKVPEPQKYFFGETWYVNDKNKVLSTKLPGLPANGKSPGYYKGIEYNAYYFDSENEDVSKKAFDAHIKAFQKQYNCYIPYVYTNKIDGSDVPARMFRSEEEKLNKLPGIRTSLDLLM